MRLWGLIDFLRTLLNRLLGGAREPSAAGEPRLLICPNRQELRAEATIGPDGGTLRIGDHRLDVPRDAIAQPVRISGTLLADRLLKLELKADDADTYGLRQPATLVLSYAACDLPDGEERLHIYRIDGATNRILADIGGDVDRERRTVAGTLRSLSIYTLGLPD